MRDPGRINQVLEATQKVWIQHPDLRLGQLLLNSLRFSDPSLDLFFVEDSVLVRKLAVMAKRLADNSDSDPVRDEQNLRMGIGRAGAGLTFVRVVHLPTGKQRTQVGLKGETTDVVGRRLAQELMNDINGTAPTDDA